MLSNNEVIRSFRHDQNAASGHLRSVCEDGARILYSYREPIAVWTPEDGLVVNVTQFSVTTSTHRNTLLRQAGAFGWEPIRNLKPGQSLGHRAEGPFAVHAVGAATIRDIIEDVQAGGPGIRRRVRRQTSAHQQRILKRLVALSA